MPANHTPQRQEVSIHAPAWGAIRSPGTRSMCRRNRCFNPRSRVGSDLDSSGDLAWRHLRPGCFNPRSRVGSDAHWHARRPTAVPDVSIHAPAWGATLTKGQHGSTLLFSIHAPRGERPIVDATIALGVTASLTIASRVGSGRRSMATSPDQGHRVSIHAPRVGSDSTTPA